MALVDYSDSDDSDSGKTPVVKPAPKVSKGTFQKVVDRSNPGKVRVSLPGAAPIQDENHNEHPAKRMKLGGGSLSDFKSFLPPPKRTGQTLSSELGLGNVAKKSAIAAGVSLKTGVAPGFSRETAADTEFLNSSAMNFDGNEMEHIAGGSSFPKESDGLNQKPANEVKLVGKPLMFKPLSVTRNPAKKKKKPTETPTTSASASGSTLASSALAAAERPLQKPKVSLFAISVEPDDLIISTANGVYQPMIYKTGGNENEESEDPSISMNSISKRYGETPLRSNVPPLALAAGAQSLDEVASEMKLSAADRRQLFGRQKGSRNGAMPSATKIINFNTDEEYRHNEELRAAGEQVLHNPVRSIAPGKHSLKQLVNAAASQKEALEESFAKGKSNRAEASSRYGW